MTKAQTDFQESTDFLKGVDERGRKCEAEQFEILGIVQRQMKGLEDQFKELREQQQKILFSRDNDTENMDEDQEYQEGSI